MRINGEYVEINWFVLSVIVYGLLFYLFSGVGWLVIEVTKGLINWVF